MEKGVYRRFFCILFLIASLSHHAARARGIGDSALFTVLKEKDSLLFNVGFNHCDISQMEKLVSNDFEFYHDQAGFISSKQAFITSFRTNVCGAGYKVRRILDEGSLEVYPMRKNGILYGAIQNGRHRFYTLEDDRPEHVTSHARFTHVWSADSGEWKLLRGLSYDHQDTDVVLAALPLDDDARMNALLKTNNVPAVGIGLIREGQLQEIRMYGELEKGKPAPYNSIFNVASLTKPITTMIALKLASDGKWDLDERLCHYWKDPDVVDDPRCKQLTTRHILNQQSGFPNWRRELKAGKLAFQFDPGTHYQYSGEGFEYLRHALENKFHKPLNVLGDELIFKPLGMTDTHYLWDSSTDSSRVATPHDVNGNALPMYKNQNANAADLVNTTIPDYGKFLLAVLQHDGLSDSIASQMVTYTVKTKENRYIGLCWFLYDLGNGDYAISHGGDDKGMHSIVFLLPKSRDGIIIFTNSDNGPKLYADILKWYLKEKGQIIVDIEMK